MPLDKKKQNKKPQEQENKKLGKPVCHWQKS